MTTRRASILLALTLLSTPTLAAPVFMLQFGSFETKDEAEKHLADLKTKYAGAIGTLSPTIREVTLPPDNLTVYRTQAGPVPTKADAQGVCSKLASAGGQCYVVETAMVPAALTPVAAAVSTVSAAPSLLAEAATPQRSVPLPSISTPPLAAPSLEVSAPALAARDATTQAAIEKLATSGSPGFSPLPELSAAPVAVPEPVLDTRPINAALDDAAARQASVASDVATAPAAVAMAAKKEERSFWSRLNPFGSDEEAVAAPAVPVIPPSDTAQAVPVDTIASAIPTPILTETTVPPTPFVVDPTVPPSPRPVAEAVASAVTVPNTLPVEPISPLPSPALVTGGEVPAPVATPLSSPAALAKTAAAPASVSTIATSQPVPAALAPAVEVPAPAEPASGSAFLLPPPPAPLRAQDRNALATGATPASAPAISAPQPTGSLSRVGETSTPIVAAPAAPGSAPAAAVTTPAIPAAPAGTTAGPVPPQPAVTLGQKTLWAQISTFDDEQEALAFWQAYTQAHPDFPAVRVRVTTPLTGHANAVSLRVGPFARVESVRNLCSTMPVKKLRCGSVTDLGVSADPRASRTGSVPDTRYTR